jgi:bifunctional UDP-N-acetylglucosamine pyrophosphorylase/glucosamine-1-phosphate N-acetyltransferase
VPGIRGDQLKGLVESLDAKSSLALMTFEAEDPTGYGRIVRGAGGQVTAIREHKDADPVERQIRECNAGVYAVRVGLLATVLPTLSDGNAAGEVYLTDLVEVAATSGEVRALRVAELDVAGVNTPEQLAAMEREMNARG